MSTLTDERVETESKLEFINKRRNKKAFITGVTGQDGSYLAELLLRKGYEVHGMVRRTSSFNRGRIEHLQSDPLFSLHYGNMADPLSLARLVDEIAPDEVYNLAAQSHVGISADVKEETADITGTGVMRLLEAVRMFQEKYAQPVKFYQASSSEMFGNSPSPQNEQTPFNPQSVYACAKVYAYHVTQYYRTAYDMFTINGILFNHESPRRGENFVTRKISRTVARINLRLENKLSLGDLTAKRDWGYAPEYMEAAWLMMQQDEPDDFVIGTGETHSVQEFIEHAFARIGIKDWRSYVKIDERYKRPAEVYELKANARKAFHELHWFPRTKFKELVALMVGADIAALETDPYGGDAA